MRILLLGGSGQLGTALRIALAPLGTVAAPARAEADLSDGDGLAALVRALAPDIIVNAAAYTAVDAAEREREIAWRINALAPGRLAEAARACGALLVHYSSDYVFDGSGNRGWRESDPTAPLNSYGHSKLEGEARIAAAHDRHIIFRTSWLHAGVGQNFVRTMLRLARERERLAVVDDQIGAPTPASLIATVTAHVLAMPGGIEPGLYHLCAGGETSWHGCARHLIAHARTLRPDLGWRAAEIAAVPTIDYPTPARRPANSRLDTGKLRAATGIALPDWHIGIEQTVEQLLAGEQR